MAYVATDCLFLLLFHRRVGVGHVGHDFFGFLSLLLLMQIRVEFACFEAMAGAVRSIMTMAKVAGRYR